MLRYLLIACALVGGNSNLWAAEPSAPTTKVLFLGDRGHHRPADRFEQLAPVLAKRGIELVYTEKLADLNADNLARFAGIAIYANTTVIEPEQEKALLEFVESGKGLIALHCASYCFLNSDAYVKLVGGQFQKHGTGTVRTNIENADHPIMRGFGGFESFDETYVHHKHNAENRTVLETRLEGKNAEPWTWVRTQGKGRVFYTAWGHDERTWGNPGFANLVERGIRWATGGDPGLVAPFAEKPRLTNFRTPPRMTALRKDVKPFEYVEAEVPFYPGGPKWGVQGEKLKKMQKPLSPEESIKHFVTPEGFEVKLFASEPMIEGKPICMCWDERGRLWICETVDYPNEIKKRGDGRDRIRILEDTNGDGLADKATLFADRLSIPTSILRYGQGVIVHQAPDTLYLVDKDGDDKADERKVLFTGWSTGDTHAGPSNLQYGHDNWIYSICGYAGFEGTVGGEKHDFRTGFFRFKPDGSKLEFLRNTNNNSWGLGFSEEGYLFGSTANGTPSVHLPIPNRYYEKVRGWSSSVLSSIAEDNHISPITEKVRQVDHHGGFTAAAGHALYTARTWPKEYWNRTAFVCEPTGHLVATFVIEPNGASFKSRNAFNILASDDEWSSPIMAEVGPDGQLWVIDWYNYIVQHNPTPAGFKNGKGNAYETPLRDKTHGRIYRVVSKTGKPSPMLDLSKASPEKLVEALKSDNLFWRKQAQRLLVERSDLDGVVEQLVKLIYDESSDELELNVGAIHALWILQGLDGRKITEEPFAQMAGLAHPAASVRHTALQIASADPKSEGWETLGVVRLNPASPTLLAEILVRSKLKDSNKSAENMVVLLQDAAILKDRWLLDAITCAASASDHHFLAAISASKLNTDNVEGAVLSVVARVAEHYGRGAPVERVGQLISQLEKLSVVGPIPATILASLARTWPKGISVKLSESEEAALIGVFAKLPAGAQSSLVSLTSRWGNKALETRGAEVAKGLLASALDEAATDPARIDAAAQLIGLRPKDAEAAKALLAAITPRCSPQLAAGFLAAISKSEDATIGQSIAERLAGFTPALRASSIQALLSKAAWTENLLIALEKGKITPRDLSLDQTQALASHPNSKIAAQAKKIFATGGGLPDADRQKVIDLLKPEIEKQGDAALGKLVFTKQCAKCHMHSGTGGKIGPDLTGMSVHPKHELLIHIFDPSRSVEGNFRAYTVVTAEGKVLTGLLASESKTAIELLDPEGKIHAVQRDEIDELKASSKSLMPEGFEKQISAEDTRNLLEFLTQRGKYVPLVLNKVASANSTRGMFYSEESALERLVFDDWTPKTFAGVPFQLVEPRAANCLLLYGPQGKLPPTMPKSVRLPCNMPAKSIHLLGGVSGWGYPGGKKGSVSLIVRLHYRDGKTEDHPLRNGEHLADYIRRVDVPGSLFAFRLQGGQQLRYLSVAPQRRELIREIELVKGPDDTAPLVMAITAESLE